MSRRLRLFGIAMGLCLCSVSCTNMHLEIPVTTLKNAEDIILETFESLEETLEESLAEGDGEEPLETEGASGADLESLEASETTAFKVVNDIRVCKNINFDTSNKVCTLYSIESGTIKSVDMHQDMTKTEECAIKFKSADSRYEGWAYLNTSGANKERPWEGTIIQSSMLESFTPRVESISGDGFTGNYTQVAVPEMNADGTGVVTVYNDTYATKDFNGTLVILHLMAAKRSDIAEYNEGEVILTVDDISSVYADFKFVDNTEYKVEEKQFNFSEPVSFVQSKELEVLEPSVEFSGEAETETAETKAAAPEKKVVEETVGSIKSKFMTDFPYPVAEQVMTGQQILNDVAVGDKPGMLLSVQNTDVIYKSVNQGNLLSLSYEFTEGEDYDIRIFGYLKANSRLEDLNTDILNYDSYYINDEGTGYIIYNIGRWDIRSITAYYVKDRLSGLLINFE